MNPTVHNRHPSPHAIQCAAAAAEAIRALNHTTGHPGNLRPFEVWEALLNLELLTHRLPRAFGQLAAHINHWHNTGRLAITGGDHAGNPAGAVAAVNTSLTHRAVSNAEDLTDDLNEAAETLAHATHTGTSAGGGTGW